MPVCINNTKPKIKKELIACNSCNKFNLRIRLEDENICRICRNKKNKSYLWCMYCEICGHLSPEDNIKGCSKCDKTVGNCCGALYHCQSTECICKNCYDYKCNFCDNDLPKDIRYISDADITSKCVSICMTCDTSPDASPGLPVGGMSHCR
jgi:hypothetical protein